jgi:hypothetical protein
MDGIKVVDRVDTQERVEKLTEEERDDYFTDLIMGKDVVKEVDTCRGKFTVKYPRSAEVVMIGKLAAARRNYRPAEAFDAGTEMLNMMASTLDVVVISGPEWFEKAKKTNKNFSFLEVPSQKLVSELYGKAYQFREKVEQRIDPPEGSADRRVPAETGNDDSVDSGSFGNLSSEQVNTQP